MTVVWSGYNDFATTLVFSSPGPTAFSLKLLDVPAGQFTGQGSFVFSACFTCMTASGGGAGLLIDDGTNKASVRIQLRDSSNTVIDSTTLPVGSLTIPNVGVIDNDAWYGLWNNPANSFVDFSTLGSGFSFWITGRVYDNLDLSGTIAGLVDQTAGYSTIPGDEITIALASGEYTGTFPNGDFSNVPFSGRALDGPIFAMGHSRSTGNEGLSWATDANWTDVITRSVQLTPVSGGPYYYNVALGLYLGQPDDNPVHITCSHPSGMGSAFWEAVRFQRQAPVVSQPNFVAIVG